VESPISDAKNVQTSHSCEHLILALATDGGSKMRLSQGVLCPKAMCRDEISEKGQGAAQTIGDKEMITNLLRLKFASKKIQSC
jgi:hypothetical protein